MKTKIFLSALFIIAFSVFTQAQETKFGGGLAYGTEMETVGINFKGSYGFTEEFALSPDFTFYIPRSETNYKYNFWEFNVNGHYIIDLESVKVYPLAGLNLTRVGFKYTGPTGGFFSHTSSYSDTELGLNIGSGVEIPLDNFGVFSEVKYVISDFDQLLITVGVNYAF